MVRDIVCGAPPRSGASLVEQFERSGQTRGRFCAANGLALSTFDLWRRKLPAPPAPVAEARPELLFVELTPPAPPQTSAASTGTGAWEVELDSSSTV